MPGNASLREAASPPHIESSSDATPENRASLLARYRKVRNATECLARPLTAEDQMLQSMPDASPTRWHRAHTTWFFETFVLRELSGSYKPIDDIYDYLFNSYYQQVGPQYPRPNRGLVSRPSVAEVGQYRTHVDEAVEELAATASDDVWAKAAELIELGCNHEQQHQELAVTDIKHAFSHNPMWPAVYPSPETHGAAPALDWEDFPGGIVAIGHDGNGFAYDNEGPRHEALLQPFALATRPVTNAEYIAFIENGGYETPRWWHAEGWDTVQREGWQAPLYWIKQDRGWTTYTLHGRVPVEADEPVCHISFFEAAAFAAWASEAWNMPLRLPTEFELEHAASRVPLTGHFAGDEPGTRALHPAPAGNETGMQQLFGDVWEWSLSAYAPYPGFRPAKGAVGEYNGKFMANQMVLRGGSVATPEGHMRASYRNFFPASARWQFSGLRLARDV